MRGRLGAGLCGRGLAPPTLAALSPSLRHPLRPRLTWCARPLCPACYTFGVEAPDTPSDCLRPSCLPVPTEGQDSCPHGLNCCSSHACMQDGHSGGPGSGAGWTPAQQASIDAQLAAAASGTSAGAASAVPGLACGLDGHSPGGPPPNSTTLRGSGAESSRSWAPWANAQAAAQQAAQQVSPAGLCSTAPDATRTGLKFRLLAQSTQA